MSRTNHPRPPRAHIPAKRPTPEPSERERLAARIQQLGARISIAAGILGAGESERIDVARGRIKAYVDEIDELVLQLKGNVEAEELVAQGERVEASA
jgi:hypothetical protein